MQWNHDSCDTLVVTSGSAAPDTSLTSTSTAASTPLFLSLLMPGADVTSASICIERGPVAASCGVSVPYAAAGCSGDSGESGAWGTAAFTSGCFLSIHGPHVSTGIRLLSAVGSTAEFLPPLNSRADPPIWNPSMKLQGAEVS